LSGKWLSGDKDWAGDDENGGEDNNSAVIVVEEDVDQVNYCVENGHGLSLVQLLDSKVYS